MTFGVKVEEECMFVLFLRRRRSRQCDGKAFEAKNEKVILNSKCISHNATVTTKRKIRFAGTLVGIYVNKNISFFRKLSPNFFLP